MNPIQIKRQYYCFYACILALAFSLAGDTASAQLKAGFKADVVNGCAPVVVNFQDTSSGNPTQWKWDLGNGTISNQQNPSTIYFSPGNYNVSLIIKNASGQDTVVETTYITVYAKPTVDFSAVPLAGCPPLPANFNDLSAPGSGVITQWSWDFGDGLTGTAKNPSHTYALGGVFGVTLTVTNSFGCQQTLQKSALVNVSVPPKANFTFSSAANCTAPVTVNFVNTSTQNPVSYIWIFGDGNSSALTSPSHIYQVAGNYLVKLIAINSAGCRDTMTQNISIGTVQANFQYFSACTGQSTFFSNTSQPAPISATWDFGDGGTSAVISPTHAFASAGTYNVKLISNFGACSASKTIQVTISNKPNTAFNVIGSNAQCALPASFQFNNTTVGASAYQWLFGDGTNSAQNNPTHNYTAAGNYTVTLISYTPGGCSDTLTKNELIKIGPPKIDSILNLPYTGCVSANIQMTPGIVSPEAIASYSWDFGDGQTSTAANPSHSYAAPGTYDVRLAVKTVGGCTDTFTLKPGVTVTTIPTAHFTQTPLDICASVPVQFTDQSTGQITRYHWDFGDGDTSNVQNPLHNFSDTGKIIVRLTVYNGACASTYQNPDTLHIKPPIAEFFPAYNCQFKYRKSFINISIVPPGPGTTYTWDYGDGNTLTTTSQLPVTHTYAQPGNYSVLLTVTSGACVSNNLKKILVIDQSPQIIVTPAGGLCKNDTMHFHVTNFDSTFTRSFSWNFGDNIISPYSRSDSIITHIYTTQGNFSPYVVVQDSVSCADTAFANVAAHVYGPTAGFTGTPAACLGTPIHFTDTSHTDGTHSIVQWIWSYGDSLTDTLTAPPFQHNYAAQGFYPVKLVVTDSYGCRDSIVGSSVAVSHPIANFTISDSIKCASNTIFFDDSSIAQNYTVNWKFGDGTTSPVYHTGHSYASPGIYTVQFNITDQFGCKDSLTKPNAIQIANPKASFILADTFATCPPLLIQPQNTSQHYKSSLWDFSDGTSQLDSPSHHYTIAGSYLLTLVVQGFGQCSDTSRKMIVLRGPTATLNYLPFKGCEPAQVNISATAKNFSALTWDFGDGILQTTTSLLSVTHTYSHYGLFTPKLLLVDTSGCKVTVEGIDTFHIAGINAGFIQNLQPSACDSSFVKFVDSSQAYFDNIQSYSWKFGDKGTSTLQNPSHYYLKTGTYNTSLIVTTSLGCTDSVTQPVPVIVYITPHIVISAVDSICTFLPVQFTATDTVHLNTPVASWQWDFGNGIGTSTLQPASYIYPASGLFTVKLSATNGDGCTGKATRNITVLPTPVVDAGRDTTLCLGQSIVFHPTGANSYVWVKQPTISCDSCTNPLAVPIGTTKYFVTGNSLGCKASDSILVQVVKPYSLSFTPADTICAGQTVQLQATGATVYQWQPSTGLSNATIPNPVASPASTTTYTLITSGNNNCFLDTALVTVVVYPIPVFKIVNNAMTISVGSADTIRTISSPDITNWEWTPSTYLSCNNCPEPVVQPKNDIAYSVKVSNPGGCTASDEVTIKVLCNGANIFVPNTFSPNGDGMNDRFYPRGKGIFTVKAFRIFNRYGQAVFERLNLNANDASAGWDGTFKGQPSASDVYVYVMEVNCENNVLFTIKGNVTLIR